mgnify:CR=1 FL=1
MSIDVLIGILIPFVGTALGAACVFFLKDQIPALVQKGLLGFASGVMVAASVWSLLIPAIEMSEDMGRMAFVPGQWELPSAWHFYCSWTDWCRNLHLGAEKSERLPAHLKKTTMLVLAVTLHNIPEGMAVGVAFAGYLSGEGTITLAGAAALAMGIAIQNFPEGAVISLPLRSERQSRLKAFVCGTLSGIVEPSLAFWRCWRRGAFSPCCPGCWAFAAGAMLYVVVEELIPEAHLGEHSNIGTLGLWRDFW